MEREENQFWTLLEGEYPAALMFCRKLMKNRDDGDDLYQDSILIAHRSFGALREVDSFKPWLYRVIVNRFKSTIRKPWWKRRDNISEEQLTNHMSQDPREHYSAKLQLAQALHALSATDRALVTLFEIEGWTIKELAELRELSEGATKVKLHRARTKMRAALEKQQRKKSAVGSPKVSQTTTDSNEERSQECIATD
jgi:RNA polymerase sigma-70 factor (ECF subfamily)